MKKPWDTWVLRGLSINEAAPLFEKMERMQMEPWWHAFGWKNLTLADGRKIKLTIQKNGIVSIYTAIAEGGEGDVTTFLLEMGWLTWDTTDTIWPLRIYTTGLERSYFSLATTGANQDVWVPTIPTLQIPDWWYESQKWLGEGGQGIPNASLDQPARYTGLARLWAQALLSVGTTATIVLDSIGMYAGVNVTTNTGVLRFASDTEGYVWWLVNVSSAGVTATKLSIPEAFRSAVNHLRNGRFIHPLEASSVEAYILAGAEYTNGLVEVKTEEDMEDVYDSRFHDRWDFCDQRFGTAGQAQAKAIAVISGGMYGTVPNKYYTSHIARVAFSSNVETLTANFSTTTPVNWAMGTSGPRIYTPVAFGTWIYIDERDGVSENSASGYGLNAPLLAFHNQDGSEYIITHQTDVANVVADEEEPDWVALDLFCGPGTSSGVFQSISRQEYGFSASGISNTQYTATARNFVRNTYTATNGGTHLSYPQFGIVDGYYWYQFGDDDCSGYQVLGPLTEEEALATYPMIHSHIGAGTGVYTETDSWSESIGLALVIGYYPRTFGVVTSKQYLVTAAYKQQVTRLSDTWSDWQEELGGLVATLENSVTALSNQSTFPGDVSVEIEYKTFPDPTFYSVWRTEQGRQYEDLDANHFSWLTGDEVSYPGFYSFASYGKEEIVALIGSRVLPDGMADAALDTYDVGAFIGGA